MLAMVVNDNAGNLMPSGACGFFASRARSYSGLMVAAVFVSGTNPPVGASMLAMFVNDDSGNLMPRGACGFFASMLAPTVD